MMLELLAILWHCDGCGAEVTQVDDDNLPTGWSCAVNGDDHHCPSCTLRALTLEPVDPICCCGSHGRACAKHRHDRVAP